MRINVPDLGKSSSLRSKPVLRWSLLTRWLPPVVHRDTRRLLLRRFPYGVFYRLVKDEIVVVGCLHAKRHPRVWRGRNDVEQTDAAVEAP